MAPIARRPCLYEGFEWQTPLCDQITTVVEAERYVMAHSTQCALNPAVTEKRLHGRWQEELTAACNSRNPSTTRMSLPCLYMGRGCTWHAPNCAEISTMTEAQA